MARAVEDTIHDAIKAAVAAGTGVSASSVLWQHERYQGGAAGRRIVIAWGPSRSIGVHTAYVTAADDGATATPEAHREQVVYVHAYGGPPTGPGSAFAALTRLQERVALPSFLGELSTAGVSLLSIGPATDVSVEENGAIEPRAYLDMTLLIAPSETYSVGAFDSVAAVGTFYMPDGDAAAEITVDTEG